MTMTYLLAFWGLLVHVAWAMLVVPTAVGLTYLAGESFGGAWLSPVALVQQLALTAAMLGYLWRQREAWPSRATAGLLFGLGLCEWVALFPIVRLYEFAQWLSG